MARANSRKKTKAPPTIDQQARALGLRIPEERAKRIPQRLDKYYQAQALLSKLKIDKDEEPGGFDLQIARASEES